MSIYIYRLFFVHISLQHILLGWYFRTEVNFELSEEQFFNVTQKLLKYFVKNAIDVKIYQTNIKIHHCILIVNNGTLNFCSELFNQMQWYMISFKSIVKTKP